LMERKKSEQEKRWCSRNHVLGHPECPSCHSAVLVRSLNHWFKVGAIWFLQAFPVRHRNLHTETSDSPRCIGVGTKNIFQSRTRQGSTSRWCDSRKAEPRRRAGRKTFLSSATRGSWEGKRFINEKTMYLSAACKPRLFQVR